MAQPDCELIPIDRGDEFPWSIIEPGEKVFMVDYSLQPWTEMVALNMKADLVWIDHHLSAIKESETQPQHKINGLREVGRAACELTWEYCFPDKMLPIAVWLLVRYDVWDLKNPMTLAFQYGLRIYNTDPRSTFEWEPLLGMDIEPYKIADIVRSGEVLLAYIDQENRKYCKAAAFPMVFEGAPCIAINRAGSYNSQMFDYVWDPEKYYFMLAFGWNKNHWKVSLYTTRDDVDCSEIAKRNGGGGHYGAAGFTCGALHPDIVRGMLAELKQTIDTVQKH
jgi:hypothetical protein